MVKLGLSFCPSKNLDRYELIKDIHIFVINLTYKFLFDKDRTRAKEEKDLSESIKHFKMAEFRALRDLILLLDENENVDVPDDDIPVSITLPIKKFKLKSKNFPDLTTSPQAWAFLSSIIGDIKRLEISPRRSNLTKIQLQTISKIQNHPDIVVTGADKEGNIVLMNRSFYENMCLKIVSNSDWYRPISPKLTISFKTQFLDIINDAFSKGLIDQDTYNYLNICSPKVATFYVLPKVH